MERCGAHFMIMDAYENTTYHCDKPIHDGPHTDTGGNYTWGVINGQDGYTKERLAQIEKRKTTKRSFWKKKRNG